MSVFVCDALRQKRTREVISGVALGSAEFGIGQCHGRRGTALVVEGDSLSERTWNALLSLSLSHSSLRS